MELQGDQYPKGLSEERVREIVREECIKTISILHEIIDELGARADGNLNQRDFIFALELVERKLKPAI